MPHLGLPYGRVVTATRISVQPSLGHDLEAA